MSEEQQTETTESAEQAPAPEEMSEHERLEAASEALLEGFKGDEEDDGADAAPEQQEEQDGHEPKEEAKAAKHEQQPEGEEDAEEQPAQEEQSEEDLAKLRLERQLRKELDSEFAKARRYEQHVKGQAAELERRAKELDDREKTVTRAEDYARQMRDNPIAFAEQIAERAGWSGAQLLERLQNRYLNDGRPGTDEVVDEVRSIREELRKEREARAKLEEEARSQQARQQLEAEKSQWVDGLVAEVGNGLAKELPYLAAYAKKAPEEFQRQLRFHVDKIYDTGGQVPAMELLRFLDNQERSAYERTRGYDSLIQGEPPGEMQNGSPQSGSGAPGETRKAPPAASRTVTSKDAANSSGARRDWTDVSEEERLAEAERILLGG